MQSIIIIINAYIESDTESTPSLLSAAATARHLTAPERDFAEVDEAPEAQDRALADAYRSLADLEVKLGPNKPVRPAKATQ